MNCLTLYIPRCEELDFYQSLLSDPATMSYNAPWFPPDGCISFPPEAWERWFSRWIGQEPTRFFAYLRRESDQQFVGYVNFHYVPQQDWWDMGILIRSSERGKGFGHQGLALLLDRAFRVDGISRLHNVFERTRAAALRLHQTAGFSEASEQDGLVNLLLTKEMYLSRIRRSQNRLASVRWIFFDLGSTLIDETKADLHRIQEMTAGTTITVENYLKKRQTLARTVSAPDKATISYFALEKTPWHSEDEQAYPDTASTLKALKLRGFRLGIIANQQPGVRKRLEDWGLLPFFDLIAASGELGMAKPEPALFLWALQQANCAPAEAVMVGDRIDNDISPAKTLGMQTIRILRGITAEYEPRKEAERPDHVIASLPDLVDLFDREARPSVRSFPPTF